jgi:hypothetical protein
MTAVNGLTYVTSHFKCNNHEIMSTSVLALRTETEFSKHWLFMLRTCLESGKNLLKPNVLLEEIWDTLFTSEETS